MITVEPATNHDIARLVELEARLFREDAGRYERFADVTWPGREGHEDFVQLLGNPSALVLRARTDRATVGFAVGYLQHSSPTRLPVMYGVLRSLYVEPSHRNAGVGSQLIAAFIEWARANGCAEAHVESYAANDGAQRFYARHGFEAVSVSRALTL
ncbi:MAG: GNAT family N-acetyltransferase [Actinobacteria bacterium]|nr:GNAT family N-acetyltransferase [Actinomycetota bacterium]